MPKLQIPGPVDDQMPLEDFGKKHVEKQKELQPEQGKDERYQRAPNIEQASQTPAFKLDNAKNIEQYAEAVREAVKFYGEQRVLERQHSEKNGKFANVPIDQEQGKRIQTERGLTERRDEMIAAAERQIELMLKTMKPATGEKLRPAVDGYLEQLMELSNVGHLPTRPGLERIENKGVLQKGLGGVSQLQMSREGDYSLVGPDGKRVPAEGDFAFAITVSNPTQIRVGSRDQGGHMALTGGGDVYFAGELHFKDGKLLSWDNGSGHYMPSHEQRKQVGETAISSLETLLPRDKYKPYNG